ncbi:MAG: ExbD/TolR family protein [Planctomycetaceae bacterium]
MKVPQRERPPGIRFNVTPLIDVVFLLVIFFLVTAHFAQNEQLEAVELPQASAAADGSESALRMVVSVTADGSLFVKGRPIAPEEFELLLHENTQGRSADYEVRIRSDQSVPYEKVEPLLLGSLRAGVTKIGFNVTKK